MNETSLLPTTLLAHQSSCEDFPLQTETLSSFADEATELNLKTIVVAYDASSAANRALRDAVTLARRFKAEVILAHVIAPDAEPASTLTALRDTTNAELDELEPMLDHLTALGVKSRGTVRNGIVGDTLYNICREEDADLLLMGAYGRRLLDRQTLGSTAEFLLSAVTCPTLTYGPEAIAPFDALTHDGPVLLPVSLPIPPGQLDHAVKTAKLFNVWLELLHVTDHLSMPLIRERERQCQQLTDRLRRAGVRAQWSLFNGIPDVVIRARSLELDSPFILMPLRWGHRLSSLTSDNVASQVIRSSKIPVMTYRSE